MIALFPIQLQPQSEAYVGPSRALVLAAFQNLQSLVNRTGGQSGIVAKVSASVSGGGGTQATAAPLGNDYNKATSGTAGVLAALQPGQQQIIKNLTGGNYKVFPATGYQIDALGVNAPYTLANTKSQLFWCSALNQIESFQPG